MTGECWQLPRLATAMRAAAGADVWRARSAPGPRAGVHAAEQPFPVTTTGSTCRRLEVAGAALRGVVYASIDSKPMPGP